MTVLPVEKFSLHNPQVFDYPASSASLVIVMSSTYGSGDPPSNAEPWLHHLLDGAPCLRGKPYGIVGFGSSQYPKFCGGAVQLDEAMQGCGARRVVPLAKCDEQGGEAATFAGWFKALILAMAKEPRASPAFTKAAIDYLTGAGSHSKQPMHVRIDFLSDEEFGAQAKDYMLYGDYAATSKSRHTDIPGHSDSSHAAARVFRQAQKSVIDGVGRRRSSSDEENLITEVAARKGAKNWLLGTVKSVKSLLPGEEPTATNFQRATTLIKIDIASCAGCQYLPGDHLVVEPRNVIEDEVLMDYCANLGVHDIDKVIFITPIDPDAPVTDEVYPCAEPCRV